VCEHPETILKIDPDGSDIQIVHVHGTYWFYDCKNLPGEIKRAARRPKDSQPSMRGFLDELLGWRSPLVVGYSGWEGDVFMTALKQRLRRTLRYNIYWFCFRRADLDGLPDWLKNNANVRLVCPDEAKTSAAQTEKSPGESTLSARDVFDELLRAFEVEDAEISRDPFGFYLNYFKKLAPVDETGGLDPYFRGVIERFESAVRSARATGTFEELRSKMRTAQYREAVGVAKRLSLGRLSPDQLREFAGAMEEAAQGLLDDSEEELAAYELTQSAFERLWAKSPDNSTLSLWARAMFYRAITLGNRDRGEEAITAYGQFVSRFANTEDPEIAEQVATALVNKGVTLGQLGQSEEAVAVYDEVVSHFGDLKEAGIAAQVALALVNKGVTLGQLGRSEEEVAVYDEVVRRFGDLKETGIAEQVAKALVYKGVTLGQLGRSEEAVAVYDELVRRFKDAKEAGIVAIVERARRLMKAQRTALGDSEPPPDGGPPEAEDPGS